MSIYRERYIYIQIDMYPYTDYRLPITYYNIQLPAAKPATVLVQMIDVYVSQNGPKSSQDRPKKGPRGPKMAPRGPKKAQTKQVGKGSGRKMAPRGPKMAPRWPQESPRWPQHEPQNNENLREN